MLLAQGRDLKQNNQGTLSSILTVPWLLQLMTDLRAPEAQKACAPLRPSYVADLRNEAIHERGIHPLRQQLNVQNEVLKGVRPLSPLGYPF